MRQSDGTELLGPNDPRSATIGIIHVAPNDDRKSVLEGIYTQERLQRKRVVIVLPEQNKAFQRSIDFDGLKDARKKLNIEMIFIAPSGPGPAELARQRRFPVFSTLDGYVKSLQDEAQGLAAEEKRGFFGFGGKPKPQQQPPPSVKPVPPPPALPPLPPVPVPQAKTQPLPPSLSAPPSPSLPVQPSQPSPPAAQSANVPNGQQATQKTNVAALGAAAGMAAGLEIASLSGGDKGMPVAPPLSAPDGEEDDLPPIPPRAGTPVVDSSLASSNPVSNASTVQPDIPLRPIGPMSLEERDRSGPIPIELARNKGDSGKLPATGRPTQRGGNGGSGKLPIPPPSADPHAPAPPLVVPTPIRQRNGQSGKLPIVGAGAVAAAGAVGAAGATHAVIPTRSGGLPPPPTRSNVGGGRGGRGVREQFGNYQLVRLLGSGNTGQVYLGQRQQLLFKKMFAIKVLSGRYLLTYEDLQDQVRPLTHLEHSNIIRISSLEHLVYQTNPFALDRIETLFLVMDYAPNGTLRDRHPKGTVLSLATILPYVKQVAAALEYAHDKKVIHGDIKPEKMLLGQKYNILLGGFDSAIEKYRDSHGVDSSYFVYWAPNERLSSAGDQYALSCVIYEWLCGSPPFTGSTSIEIIRQHVNTPPTLLRSKNPSIPLIVEKVVLKALSKEPKDRFDSVQAFADALEQASLPPKPIVVNTHDRVGQQFGNYRLKSLLGHGGFADVYLAQHKRLYTYAAIKVIHTRLSKEEMESFEREAQTIANLKHPSIVRVLDFAMERNTPFLVMDHAPHGTLRQRHLRGSRLPLNAVVSYVKQVAYALQYAHDQKLIHRDVKPENMLIGSNGEILLSDFGIAVVAHGTHSQRIPSKILSGGKGENKHRGIAQRPLSESKGAVSRCGARLGTHLRLLLEGDSVAQSF